MAHSLTHLLIVSHLLVIMESFQDSEMDDGQCGWCLTDRFDYFWVDAWRYQKFDPSTS